jgi:transcriptional regulator with XRE-family HTH domain
MANSSHITNLSSSVFDRTLRADIAEGSRHIAVMSRRGIPDTPPDWFLVEWMRFRGITKQTQMMKLTGWSKATMSQLYNGKQDYSPKILREAAEALDCEPFELLMLPTRAESIWRVREAAKSIASEGGVDAEPVKSRARG